MQKAINRFWDWLFHPGIRWYHYPKGKSAWFRYPSPGSYIEKAPREDYKQPYESSPLNVRYAHPLKSVAQTPDLQFVADNITLTTEEKLKRLGFLEDGEINQEKLEKAKQKFQQKFGVPVETRVYRDEIGMASTLPEGTNRQSYRMFVENSFKTLRESNKAINNPNVNRRFIQNPERIWLESLDMFSHPHFQQTRIEVGYKLDNHGNENAKRGYIEMRKGEKTFWKALDDSNDPKNIEKVQRAVGDDKPTDFTLRDTKTEFVKDANGNVVDVRPKTQGL